MACRGRPLECEPPSIAPPALAANLCGMPPRSAARLAADSGTGARSFRSPLNRIYALEAVVLLKLLPSGLPRTVLAL